MYHQTVKFVSVFQNFTIVCFKKTRVHNVTAAKEKQTKTRISSNKMSIFKKPKNPDFCKIFWNSRSADSAKQLFKLYRNMNYE